MRWNTRSTFCLSLWLQWSKTALSFHQGKKCQPTRPQCTVQVHCNVRVCPVCSAQSVYPESETVSCGGSTLLAQEGLTWLASSFVPLYSSVLVCTTFSKSSTYSPRWSPCSLLPFARVKAEKAMWLQRAQTQTAVGMQFYCFGGKSNALKNESWHWAKHYSECLSNPQWNYTLLGL